MKQIALDSIRRRGIVVNRYRCTIFVLPVGRDTRRHVSSAQNTRMSYQTNAGIVDH